jgi:hypothetical protein
LKTRPLPQAVLTVHAIVTRSILPTEAHSSSHQTALE